MKKSNLFRVLIAAVVSAVLFTACTAGTQKTSEKERPQGTLEEIMTSIYDGVEVELPPVVNTEVTKENSDYYFGIENMDFVQAIASEPMIGSIAHSICLAELPEGADVEAVKKEIKEKVDPRKWICVGVEREDVQVVNRGNLILLVLQQKNPQAFVDSFMNLE